ncbi:MAG: DUF58 domain-containing protein [Nitrospirae bacterium]|nr:DUF58 domain-containing protein [Nitrospirota bacterium]
MIPRELVKKIRRIRISTNHAVNDVLAGEYQSVFKGQGMEFEEVREYLPGDEIRTIDWNVTARFGHPYVKRFVEERELTVMLLVDLSSSGRFGSVDQLKNEVAAELCALLAFSAIKNNDKVGLIIFTDRIEKFLPPQKGSEYVLRVIRELLYFKPTASKTDIGQALAYLGRVTTKRTVAFLVSDFLNSGFEKPLRVVSKRHDLIAVTITDPREISLPDVGIIELEDAETGETILFDTRGKTQRKEYEKYSLERARELEKLLRSADVDQIHIRTDRSYIRPLVRFFRLRERRI